MFKKYNFDNSDIKRFQGILILIVVFFYLFLLIYYIIFNLNFFFFIDITKKLSEADVLELIPPSVIYNRRSDKPPSTTATRCAWRRTPLKVVDWTEFLTHVEKLTPSTNPIYERKMFRFDGSFRVARESDLYGALDANIFNLLQKLVDSDEFFGSCSAHPVKAEPDRIFYKNQEQLFLAIEVKTKDVLALKDLVEKYNIDIKYYNKDLTSPKNVVYQVNQIFGYLSWNELQYGVLTTYEETWFLKRNAGTLYVSPAIKYTSISPTLFRCYITIMNLARKSPFNAQLTKSPKPPPPPESSEGDNDDHDDDNYNPDDSDDQDSDNNNNSDDDDNDDNSYSDQKRRRSDDSSQSKQKRVKRGDNFSQSEWGNAGSQNSQSYNRVVTRQLSSGFSITIGDVSFSEFKCRDLLGEGRTGKVFRAEWHGEMVAVKLCDLYQHPDFEEEVLTEVAVYNALKPLQGLCIPHLKLAGYDNGLFIIATEIAGSPLKVEKLNYQERLDIVNKLSLIHSFNIIHNDIGLQNILISYCNDGYKVCFIDFAMSKQAKEKVELEKEMMMLKILLNLLVNKYLLYL